MATQDVEILQVDTSQSVQSVASLRKEIKGLKDQLLNLEQGTKEYNDTLVELGNKTHELREIQQQVRQTTTDFGDSLSNLRGTITGVTGAFQTVLGSLSLLGVNLGDDVKMLKMLQSAMAITQGVSAIDAGVKSFKALTISIKASTAAMSGLKKALLSSGIGAIILLVGALASGLIDMGNDAEISTDKAKQGFDKLKSSISHTDRELKRVISRMQAMGASDEEIFNKQKAHLEGQKAQWMSYKTEVTRQMAEITNKGASYTKKHQAELDELKKLWQDAENNIRGILEDIADLENEHQNKQIIGQREAAEKGRKQAEEDAKKAAAQAEKDRVEAEQAADEAAELAHTQNMEARQRAELRAETKYQQQRAELTIQNADNLDEQLLQLDMQYRDTREELLRQRYEWGLLTTEEFNNQLAQLELEAAELQIEQEQQVTEKTKEELEKRKKLQETYVKAVKSVVSSITSVMSAYGDTLEQGTTEWKNLKATETMITTIAGSVEAFFSVMRSVGGGWWGIAAGAIAAASTLASGLIEVQKIQNTKVDKSSSPSAGGSSALGSVSASAVSVNATQVTATRPVQTEDDIANLPDTRVYVLEQDITKAQNKVRVTNQNATY